MQSVSISLSSPSVLAGAPGAQPPHHVDAAALSDALFEGGALSVSITPPAAAESIFHEVPPGAVTWEPPSRTVWAGATVTATFAAGIDVDDVLLRLAATAGLSELPPYHVQPVDAERDWVSEVQAGFPPVRVGRLLIQYPWHGAEAGAREQRGGGNGPPSGGATAADSGTTVVIPIEPGCAFGTGEHPTTRLVLGFLQSPTAAVAGARVLDYGCGSGVLALAAAALGAASVVGVDIDPDAVAVAASNAVGGGRGVAVAAVGDAPPAPPPPLCAADLTFLTNREEPDAVGAYDVVVANILAKPLVALAPLLRRRATRGGRLALAGVLAEQGLAVRDAYEAAGWAMGDGEVLDGWVLLTGVAR